MIFPMKSIKVEGSLGKNRGDSRLIHTNGLRHINRLIHIIIVILVLLGYLYVAMEYTAYQLNSEKFFNAHTTIVQLSEKYGYVDEYSLTVEELLEADDDVTDGRMNKIYYLDRQGLSKEDYVKYTDVRDYYAGIMHTPYTLSILGSVLTMFSLMYIVYILIK